jgi:hypothetical protein
VSSQYSHENQTTRCEYLSHHWRYCLVLWIPLWILTISVDTLWILNECYVGSIYFWTVTRLLKCNKTGPQQNLVLKTEVFHGCLLHRRHPSCFTTYWQSMTCMLSNRGCCQSILVKYHNLTCSYIELMNCLFIPITKSLSMKCSSNCCSCHKI